MTNKGLYAEVQSKLDMYYKTKSDDIWRNKFHIEMPFGLINDPNGLSYFNGEYYIFFQWNPFGCEHKTKHWALVKTKDFVKFTKPQIILKPEDWFDKNGCYSGGAYVDGDVLKLFYTGNVKNEKNERSSYQCLAQVYKDGTFEKKGVLIDGQPEGYTAHFRDPVIFKKGSTYYMLLGIQNNNLKGRSVIYKSDDLEKWNFLGELKTGLNDFGYMWECPNIVNVADDKYAFLFCPQGLSNQKFKYQNIYQSGYIIGDLDSNSVSLSNCTEFKEIDMGFDFYAPQVFDKDGQNILIGWIGMPDKDDEYKSSENGWMGSLTMPRVIEFKNNVLYQKPFMIDSLRDQIIKNLENLDIQSLNIDNISKGIECYIDISFEKECEIRLNFGEEYISITYDKKSEECIINRENMYYGGKGIRRMKLSYDKSLRLDMYIDSSICEIYYQDGKKAATINYFPKENDFDIEIKSKVKINKLTVWKLKEIRYE